MLCAGACEQAVEPVGVHFCGKGAWRDKNRGRSGRASHLRDPDGSGQSALRKMQRPGGDHEVYDGQRHSLPVFLPADRFCARSGAGADRLRSVRFLRGCALAGGPSVWPPNGSGAARPCLPWFALAGDLGCMSGPDWWAGRLDVRETTCRQAFLRQPSSRSFFSSALQSPEEPAKVNKSV